MSNDYENVFDPSFTEGIAELSMEDLRDRRDQSQAVENALSFVRRVVHGRLDIVGAELTHRRDGTGASDPARLVGELTEVLADGSGGGGGIARPPQDLDPSELAEPMLAELDQITGGDLASIGGLDDDGVDDLLHRLETFEGEVSDRRHRIHEVIDTIQAEIIRRYRTGEASVDSLLT